jgi:hypothetical protein
MKGPGSRSVISAWAPSGRNNAAELPKKRRGLLARVMWRGHIHREDAACDAHITLTKAT